MKLTHQILLAAAVLSLSACFGPAPYNPGPPRPYHPAPGQCDNPATGPQRPCTVDDR